MANSFDLGSITATVEADISNFKKGFEEAKKTSNEFSKNLDNIGKGIKEFSNQATIFTGAVVAGFALFANESVKAYGEAQMADAMLEHAVIQVTKATSKQLEETIKLADALERKGVLDGDNIKVGLAQLSTFGLSNKAVQGLGGSLADLAVNQFGVNASGEQLSQTANMIAKALNGQFGVLEKSGIRFTDLQKSIIATGTEMEKVKAINEGFAQNLKLTNAVARETSDGQMAHLNVVLGNVQEAFGGVVAIIRGPFAGALSKMLENSNAIDFLQGIGDKIYWIQQLLITGDFTKSFGMAFNVSEDSQLVTFLLDLRNGFIAFSDWVKENKDTIIAFMQGFAMAIGTLMIIGTINALLTALLNPFFLLTMAITAFWFAYNTNFLGIRDVTNAVVTAIVGFFNEVFMPFILVLVQFFTDNWTTIQLVFTTVWDLIKIILQVAIDFIFALVSWFMKWAVQFFKDNWEIIKVTIDSVWKVIVGIFQVAFALIGAIFTVFTALLTGKWDEAFVKLKSLADMGWNGIKNIFNGIIGFIAGWGGQLFKNLVKPFEDAWNKISELIKKIQDALDFTKRHSPSVLDIVKKGVGLVNNALGELAVNPTFDTNTIANTVANGGQSMSIASIQINLDGAVIGDDFTATRIGEKIGDSIMQKLKMSVRF